MRTRAFTLIELLVVIAVISILFAVIVPALNLARQKASTTVCLSNTKNLSLGWYMYMGDNDGRIMSSEDGGTEKSGRYVGWIGIPRNASGTTLNITQTDPAVTDEDEIRGIQRGLLYPYLKEVKAYHCPGDKVRKSLYDKTNVFVSYSVPMCLYGYPNSDNAMHSKQIRVFSEIKAPSTRYVFVEAAETRNWNSSHHFVMAAPEYTNLSAWGWWGPIAVNHGDSSVLGYTDGHSEVRRWRDKYTIERVDKLLETGATNYGQDYPPTDQTLDIEYMAAGWAYRAK
ncbi:MAG: type II secretion system protein [Phycisphaerae bacterium]|nr:type II secretion system protein [Phycisphaerae bacterium]